MCYFGFEFRGRESCWFEGMISWFEGMIAQVKRPVCELSVSFGICMMLRMDVKLDKRRA